MSEDTSFLDKVFTQSQCARLEVDQKDSLCLTEFYPKVLPWVLTKGSWKLVIANLLNANSSSIRSNPQPQHTSLAES